MTDIIENEDRSAVVLPNKLSAKIESGMSENTLAISSPVFPDGSSLLNLKENTNFDSKRNKELHQRFPEISASELLIENYVCALGRGAKLIQGRIFITSKRTCFYSGILGMTMRITMYFDDIQSIKRKVSVCFIPNAIEIVSDSTVFYFCSFLSRDPAYERLVTIWKQSNIESFFASPPYLGESKSTMTSRPGSPATIPDSLVDPSVEECSAEAREALNGRGKIGDCRHIHTEYKSAVLCDETFPTSAKVLWGLLHGDKPSHIVTVDDASAKPCFLDWFLGSRAVKNLEKTSWIMSPREGMKNQEETDVLEFDKAAVGAKRSLYFDMNIGLQTATSKQVFAVTSYTPSSICIESRTTNSGVPFSSSYSTMIYTCIHEVEGGLCRLFISYKVVFEKDCYSIIKNPVSTAIKGRLPEFYNALTESLNLHFKITSRGPSINNVSPALGRASNVQLTSSSSRKNNVSSSSGCTQIVSDSHTAESKSEYQNSTFASSLSWLYVIFTAIWFLFLAHLYWEMNSISADLIQLQRDVEMMKLNLSQNQFRFR